MKTGKAVIVGAGPAGLTAAFELLEQTEIEPVVLEKSGEIGGISRTVRYKGNRIDIGGHRFFSKSDRVMRWWLARLPLEARVRDEVATLGYQNKTREVPVSRAGPDPALEDLVMLLRERRSRIFYLRRFFDYPISLKPGTLLNLGLRRTL
ncbi:MAG: NAD(P)-binding protein, partial [Planctomycetota bacterium]|nr:NAD(P)-binding protein [Planctomycetota bacterium]